MSMIKRQPMMHGILLALVVVAVYGRSLGHGFVWDDRVFFIGRQVYKEFLLGRMFLGLGNGVEYLPLRDVTYGLDYLFWGERAAGFHLTNLLLFMAVVLLVYGGARRLLLLVDKNHWEEGDRARQTAFVAAILFASHPLNSEAVNFVTCRNVLVSGVFFFGACYGYLRFLATDAGRRRWYGMALLSFLAALLAKATVVTLPLLLALLIFHTPAERRRQAALGLVPFFLLAFGGAVLHLRVARTIMVINEQLAAAAGNGLGPKLARAVQIPFFYLWKVLLPVGFSAEYDVRFAEGLTGTVLLAGVGILAIAWGAFFLRRRFPELPVGLGWFFAALIPVLNFFVTNPPVADRYVFLPLFGIALLVAAGLARLCGNRSGLLLGISLAVTALWGGLAFARSGAWQSDMALWTANIATAPKQLKGHFNLANEYYLRQEYDAALRVLEQGEKTVPLQPEASYMRGLIARRRGDQSMAIAMFDKALGFDDEYLNALDQLVAIYEEQGDLANALRYCNRILTIRRDDERGVIPRARQQREILLGRVASLLAPLRDRLAAVPGDLAVRGQLALQLDNMGLTREALDNYREMERAGYRNWTLYYNMGNAYLTLQQPREAADYFEKCLAAHPGYTSALNGLGVARMQLRDYRRAIDAFQAVVQLDGSDPIPQFNLAKTYFQMGDKAKAIQQFRRVGELFPQFTERAENYIRQIQES